MPSNAFGVFTNSLATVDEILSAAPGPGRPHLGHTGAVVKGALVHLTAALEGYVEAVFEESARALWPNWTAGEYKALFDMTTDKFQNAHEFNTNRLFFNLGFPWIVSTVSWQGFPNASVRGLLADLYRDRGAVAHGRGLARLTKPEMHRRRDLVARYVRELDASISALIGGRVGAAPW